MRGRPVVYDFDDAVFLPNTSEANSFAGSLKYPQKVPSILAALRSGHRGQPVSRRLRAPVQPGGDDHSNLPRHDGVQAPCGPRPRRASDGPPVVGWIGTPTTAAYLSGLAKSLRDVAARHPFVFRVSGAGAPLVMDGVTIAAEPWTLASEVDLFNTCDVGVYPLADDEWAQGKCGFKAIQFMACGVPVVAARRRRQQGDHRGRRQRISRDDRSGVDRQGGPPAGRPGAARAARRRGTTDDRVALFAGRERPAHGRGARTCRRPGAGRAEDRVSPVKNFAMTGVAGFVAPRHLEGDQGHRQPARRRGRSARRGRRARPLLVRRALLHRDRAVRPAPREAAARAASEGASTT